MERRRKLGLPLEDPPKKQAPAENPEPAKEENKVLKLYFMGVFKILVVISIYVMIFQGFVRVKPVSKAEQFRSLLREMKHAHQVNCFCLIY